MKPRQFSFAALATLLISSALWSCNKDNPPSQSAAMRRAQEQQAAPTMPSRMPGTGNGTMDQLRAACPMLVQGADVTVADTDRGVALTFTTEAGDVVDLRTRVRHMAQMYKMHREHTGRMWQRMGGGGVVYGGRGMDGEGMGHGRPNMRGERMGHMAGRGPMPAASETVADTDKGARLELRPTDPSQLDALREHVRWHQERMHSSECWMPQGQPTKTPQGGEPE